MRGGPPNFSRFGAIENFFDPGGSDDEPVERKPEPGENGIGITRDGIFWCFAVDIG